MGVDVGVVEVLELLVHGDEDGARRAAVTAAASPGGSLLADALASFLSGGAAGSVYDQPQAFEAFIRGGGNVALYRAVTSALARRYEGGQPHRVVDIGCGDGLAVTAALSASRHTPAELDLVEPSAALLETAVRRVRDTRLPVAVREWPGPVQDFVTGLEPGRGYPLAESTFALHTVPPEQRSQVLSALRPMVGLLVIAEFDVPALEHAGPDHLRFLAETYERGLAEYDDDRELVAQGFLMPVLTGQLAPGAARVTWEQSAGRWERQVVQAGYTETTRRPLCDYWSSPAFLLTARGGLAS